MLYILTALKPEAQAFVDKYKLLPSKLDNYKLFQNDKMIVIVSGLGVKSARLATQTLINNFDITDDDIYLNIGICGASKEYDIGSLLSISTLVYQDITYSLSNTFNQTLHCLDKESSTEKYAVVDMESYGFYDAVVHSPAIKSSYILKVVSDHFQPHLVTKEKTKMLIFNAIDDINSILFNKETF
jgi:nucleoside phosphorylase